MADPLDALRLPIVPVEPRPEFAAELMRRLLAREAAPPPGSATVRYFVDDVDAAIAFYRDLLGFELEVRPSPAFAMLYRGELRLLLSVPSSHVLPDGMVPQPGGWNRISLVVADLEAAVERLREGGARLRGGVTAGVGVRLALVEDPSGNLVELVEPRAGYHERARINR